VDQLGNFRDAVELAKEMGGIRGEATLIYPKRRTSRLLDFLMDGAAKGLFRATQELFYAQPAYRWEGAPTSW